MIVLIVGDFCVGKDTVCDNLVGMWTHNYVTNNADKPESVKILSYATRPPRYEGENTHEFCSREEFLNFDDLVAQTKIGDEYYGTRRVQFDNNKINFYVVDGKGVIDILDSHIDDTFVVEVVRPNWLINCPQKRQDRERHFDVEYPFDYRIINDGDLNKLERLCSECLSAIIKHYLGIDKI